MIPRAQVLWEQIHDVAHLWNTVDRGHKFDTHAFARH